jgi:acyl-CoA synthetase (AMP-forming)/AMP-acid ligase II
MEFNLADLLELVADTVPEREAVSCGKTRLSYAELDERATRLANALAGLGAGPGQHVGLYLNNCPEFIEGMLACFKIRAVPININYRYEEDELAYLFDDADLVAVVHHREFAPRIEAIRAGLTKLRHVIEVDDGSDLGPETLPSLAYEQLVSTGSPERRFARRSGDDHYVLYTGGTTGLPKGVVWRHEDILFATLGGGNPGRAPIGAPGDIAATVLDNRAQRIGPFLPEGDPGPDEFVSLALGPLMHASGQWSALGTLLGGGRTVLYPHRTMDMAKVLDLVESERVAMLTLVGDASGRPLLGELEARPGRTDTSSLRLLGSGGSILSGEVKDRLLAALPTVLAISEAIGSSEAPVQAVAVAKATGKPSSSLAFAGREMTMVVRDDLTPIAPGSGEVGRLATRGRIPIGYYNDPEKSAATFVTIDGERWSLPGDMAVVEKDGTIRLLGRGAMCINTGGEKVYPEEVEAVLKSHPKVVDTVIVGKRDPVWGERVVAVVQPVTGSVPTLEELREHCRTHVAGYKAPRELHVVEQVVRTPSGKADYRWARQVATTGEG